MKYVGVDIGGTNLKAGLADENGQLLAVQKMKVASVTDQQSLAWTIVAMTQELAKSAGVPLDDIASVGVGVPGTVEIRSGSIGYTCNLPLRNVPLRKLFHNYLSIPLYIENDANCAALADYAGQAHGECSGEKEELTLTYQTVRTVTDPFGPQMDIYQALRQHMEDHAAAERASRLCLSGPHKDDLEVLINGRSARQFASQGQVRTAALSLKLAEREIHKNAVGEYPVMLLDDVLSELDPRRQEYVLNRIRGGQVFITCCENDRLDTMLRGRVFHIRNGEVL